MKKLTHKYAAALMLLGVVAGMELAAGTTTASAKTSNTSPWEYGKTGKYAWSAPKDDAAPLYYTNTKKNGYIWNKIFTKNCTISKTINILHGTLKNRSNVTEKCITRLPVIKYQDMYGTAMLPPAISKRISTFKSDSSYIKYLNTDKSQKLSRAVLKYFPNAKVSVDLSRRGAGQFVDNKPITKAMTTSNYKHVINLTALSHDLKTSYGSTYSETILNTLDFPVTTTNAAVAKTVNSILIKNGYTQAKISNLIKQGYKLGIYINGGTGISAGKQGYPWTINTNAGTMNNAALFLAK